MSVKKHVRYWHNSAKIKPGTHLTVVLFVTAVVAIAAALCCYFFHIYLQHILQSLASSGSLTAETTQMIDDLFYDLLILIGIVELVILLILVLVSLNYVFKVTGAEYALARHVREKMLNGNWDPLYLRKGDALGSIALELNKLSEQQSGGVKPNQS